MRLDVAAWLGLGLLSFALTACGSDDTKFAGSDGGVPGGGAGGSSGSSGGAGGSSGNGGSPLGGAGGAAGARPISCTGTWGTTAQLVLQTASQVEIASATLSPDELELLYSAKLPGLLEWHFRSSVRSAKSVAFTEGSVLPELDAACSSPDQDRSVDLSRDGLRAYVQCYLSDAPPMQGPLRIARRSAIGKPWVLDSSTTSPEVGPSVSVSTDELVLYSTTKTRPGPPLTYTRTSTSAAFSDGAPVPGLESVNIEALDPSPDGLSVHGWLDYGIAVATRSSPSGPFGAPTALIPGSADDTVGSPELSADCRSLYYIHVVGTSSPRVYTIEMRAR